MEKLHVSAYSGHHQVLTAFLLKELYIMCLNRVVMLRSDIVLRAFVKLILVGCLLGQDIWNYKSCLLFCMGVKLGR